MDLTMINEDGEVEFIQHGIKGQGHAQAFVRDFNQMNYHRFTGKFQGKIINWDGKLV